VSEETSNISSKLIIIRPWVALWSVLSVHQKSYN